MANDFKSRLDQYSEAAFQRCSAKKVLLEILQNLQKASGLQRFKKEILEQVFSCEFCEISKVTFLYRTPLVVASEYLTVVIYSNHYLSINFIHHLKTFLPTGYFKFSGFSSLVNFFCFTFWKMEHIVEKDIVDSLKSLNFPSKFIRHECQVFSEW